MPSHPWDNPPNAIASEIANEFFPVTSLQNAELRRRIIAIIEAEREVSQHYLMQMGRWVNAARERGVLR